MILSYKLDLGNFHSPGPGLMPFLLGVTFLLVSTYHFVRSFVKAGDRNGDEKIEFNKAKLWKLSIVMGSLLVYLLFFETVGYLITTFFLLVILFRSAGSKKWSLIVIGSALVVLITYFGFNSLGLRLPKGIFQWR